MTDDLSLRLTQFVQAAPGKVFDAWLDPAMLAKFMTTGPQSGVEKAETDPRVGGRYDIVMTNEMGAVPHWGEYRTIERPDRLAFTWNSPHASPDSLVTLTFTAEESGTLVTLVHEHFPSEASRDGHTKGWSAILATLAEWMPSVS